MPCLLFGNMDPVHGHITCGIPPLGLYRKVASDLVLRCLTTLGFLAVVLLVRFHTAISFRFSSRRFAGIVLNDPIWLVKE